MLQRTVFLWIVQLVCVCMIVLIYSAAKLQVCFNELTLLT